MSASIIQFPTPSKTREGKSADIEKMDDPVMSVAADAIDALVYELLKLDYDPLSSAEMLSDLNVILNTTYAMLLRHEGRYHVLHSRVDETAEYLEELRLIMDNHKGLFEE
jgi:hypothetical protein